MSKNVTVVIGGQYGSEGKGRVCGFLAPEFDICVRVGGPNAGHTVWDSQTNKEYKFRQLPVAAIVNKDCTIAIGAGGIINLDVLREEIGWVGDVQSRLIIDRNAAIIEQQDVDDEVNGLFQAIGSTTKGVGACLARKIRRRDFRTAKDIDWLAPYIDDVAAFLHSRPTREILIEGTQGYALSLNHGPYPFCTSRDVLASSILSDVGLSPMCVKDIIMVVRTYPIRVFGNSGPMFEEISWQDVTKISGAPELIIEKTTVTNRVRRVGKFDWNLLMDATAANTPTQIAVNFIDYIDYLTNHAAHTFTQLSIAAKQFIKQVEDVTGSPVTIIGTGPLQQHTVDRRADYGMVSRLAR